MSEEIICSGCGWEIDPETCHCGDTINHHGDVGHNPVPVGCTCGYPDAEKRKAPSHSPNRWTANLTTHKSHGML